VTVTVYGHLILISKNFYHYFLHFLSLVLFSIEKIYQTLKTVFDFIAKQFDVRQKYSATSRTVIIILIALKLIKNVINFFVVNNNNNNNRYLNRVTPSVAGLVSTGALYNVK